MTASARRFRPNKWWVLTTAVFGVFLSLLDATSVNTALPTLHPDLHTASLVATASQLAAGAVCAAAFLGRRLGLKRAYLGSLTLTSLLCLTPRATSTRTACGRWAAWLDRAMSAPVTASPPKTKAFSRALKPTGGPHECTRSE